MEQQDLDRNEAATPYKLEKAREKAQVARSAEAVSALVFTVAAVWFYAKGWDGLKAVFWQCRVLLAQAGRQEVSFATLGGLAGGVFSEGAALLLPFLGGLMLAGVLGNLLQTGPVLSLAPVQPDLDRLNPLNGVKKLLSLRTLFDGGRAIVKLALLSLVLFEALAALVPHLFRIGQLPPGGVLATFVDVAAQVGVKLAAALCFIGLLDLAFTRREFAQRMRMSKREITDEHKHREGDPRVKSRIRQLRQEMLRRSRSLRNASSAAVVITNPTHYAVALKYVHGEMHSPQVVAKGAGFLAAAIRHIASRHQIPVVQNPPLARQLFRELDLDHHLPPSLYAPVARILVWLMAAREANSRHGAAA